MIFVTVGTQLAFDRLLDAVDAWAEAAGVRDVFAQAGPTQSPPRHIEWRAFLSPQEHDRRFADASLVVAHAGMGTILAALSQRKPIVIMPRRAALGEQRNDHQVATARHFAERHGVRVAMDADELRAHLDEIDMIVAGDPIPAAADESFIAALRTCIIEGRVPARSTTLDVPDLPPVIIPTPSPTLPTPAQKP